MREYSSSKGDLQIYVFKLRSLIILQKNQEFLHKQGEARTLSLQVNSEHFIFILLYHILYVFIFSLYYSPERGKVWIRTNRALRGEHYFF